MSSASGTSEKSSLTVKVALVLPQQSVPLGLPGQLVEGDTAKLSHQGSGGLPAKTTVGKILPTLMPMTEFPVTFLVR